MLEGRQYGLPSTQNKKIIIKLNTYYNMAISCKLNKNLLRSNTCGYSLPEIVDLYLINYEDLSATTIGNIDSGTCEGIESVTLTTGSKVYHVEPAKNSASFEDTLVVEDSGARYRNASVTFNVTGTYNACMHEALDALALGRYFVVIKTADGNYLGMGRISPLEAETATLSGGGDTNGLQIVLSGNIAESPMPLSATAVETILGAIATN